MSTRIEKIRELIDLDNVTEFITKSRGVADAVETIFQSSKTDDDKVVGIFDACVEYGLYDESDLPD